MFIKLIRDESYRGKDCKEGDIIEVGDALGEKLILNGHKRSSAQAQSGQVEVLDDDEVEALDYEEVKALVAKYELDIKDKKQATLKDALKVYFYGIRG